MHYLTKILSSYKTSLGLMLGYALVLAIATFIEKQMGTMAAKMLVYYSPLFIFWQFLMVVNFVAIVWKHRLWERPRWGMMTIHAAFIVILAGALCSHLFSIEGLLHLREGEQSNRIAVRTQKGTYFHTLPFEVELIDFTLARYPGSTSPSSFESEVRVHVDGKTQQALIFMNNVLDVKGYRFYQASYDADERGTILSVNHDILGRNITYSGYFLLSVGFVLSFFGKRSRFRILAAQLKRLQLEKQVSALCLVGLLFFPGFATAEEHPRMDLGNTVRQFAVNPEHAAAFGLLPMQSESGRMIPVNTFASEVLRKLHKSETFGQLNSDQFLLSLLALPDMWMRVPLIPVSNTEIISRYHLPGKACSYLQMFDSYGAYKFQQQVEEAYSKQPNERTRFDKDLMKLDEQVNILHQLLNYRLLRIFPQENNPAHKWYAPGDDLSAYSGKDSLFVSHIFNWYLGEVQTALKTQDWSKADEILAMISKYQQAKNHTLDIRPQKMQAEVKYNRMNIFSKCKVGYLITGGLLLILSFVRMFQYIHVPVSAHRSHPGRIPFPYLRNGDALVYRRICSLEQFLRDDGLCSLGDRRCRGTFRAQSYYPCFSDTFRRHHPLCIRLELDGPANRDTGAGTEIPLADVSCCGHCRRLRLLRHLLPAGNHQHGLNGICRRTQRGVTPRTDKRADSGQRDVFADRPGLHDYRHLSRSDMGQ